MVSNHTLIPRSICTATTREQEQKNTLILRSMPIGKIYLACLAFDLPGVMVFDLLCAVAVGLLVGGIADNLPNKALFSSHPHRQEYYTVRK